MKYTINRTVSYYDDETTTLECDFYKEFPNSTIEVLDDYAISGIQTVEIECNGFDELVSYCTITEGIGECFSVYDEKGYIILTEEYLEEKEYEDLKMLNFRQKTKIMNAETAEKLVVLQDIVNKFNVDVEDKIYEICEGLSYKESSSFSYNIDLLKQFVERINSF